MKMLTKILLLAGAGGAIYALTRESAGAPEGGDTTEPGTCPPGQEWNEDAQMCVPAPPESSQFDPHTPQPATEPPRFGMATEENE